MKTILEYEDERIEKILARYFRGAIHARFETPGPPQPIDAIASLCILKNA